MNPRFKFTFDWLWYPKVLTAVLVALLFAIYAIFSDSTLRIVATLAVFITTASIPIWRSVHFATKWDHEASIFLTSVELKNFQLGLYYFSQKGKNIASRRADIVTLILEGFKRHRQRLSSADLIMAAEIGLMFLRSNGKGSSPLLDNALGTLKERTLSPWHEARLKSLVLQHLNPK